MAESTPSIGGDALHGGDLSLCTRRPVEFRKGHLRGNEPAEYWQPSAPPTHRFSRDCVTGHFTFSPQWSADFNCHGFPFAFSPGFFPPIVGQYRLEPDGRSLPSANGSYRQQSASSHSSRDGPLVTSMGLRSNETQPQIKHSALPPSPIKDLKDQKDLKESRIAYKKLR